MTGKSAALGMAYGDWMPSFKPKKTTHNPLVTGKRYLCRLCGKPARFQERGPHSKKCRHVLENTKVAQHRKKVHEAAQALAKEFDPDHPSRRVFSVDQVYYEKYFTNGDGDYLEPYTSLITRCKP